MRARRARERVQKRRNLQGGVAAYVVVNLFLVVVWALSAAGATSGPDG